MSDAPPLGIVRRLLDRLNADGIVYCHWKSNQHFRDALSGKDDLDILIDRARYDRVMGILHSLSFKHFYVPPARSYVGIEDFLGFDPEQGKLVHLHLHSQLVVGEKHLKGFLLPIESDVLGQRRFDESLGVYMSSRFHELLLLILRLGMKVRKRDFFKSSMLSGSTKAEFDWLKEGCPDFSDALQRTAWLTPRLKQSVLEVFGGDVSWWRVTRLKHQLYADLAPWSRGSGLHNIWSRTRREIARIVLEIQKRYLHTLYPFTRRRAATGGLTLAFLGSDGAGKSSAIAEIHRWLREFMDVRVFYLGSGDGSSSLLRLPLKWCLEFAKKRKLVKTSNNFSDSSLKEVGNRKLSLARKLWIYALSTERIGKLLAASRCRLRGYVVLTDRYPQAEFPGLCDGPRLPDDTGFAGKKEAECFRLAGLCPPDLVVKLIVPPEVAVRRKPGEVDFETSRNLTERVKQIRFSSHTECVEIDAAQKQEAVWLAIKNAIWNAMG